MRDNGVWRKNLEDRSWSKEIVDIILKVTDKTPGSFLEEKKTALVWHFRNVDPWVAALREQQLFNMLGH